MVAGSTVGAVEGGGGGELEEVEGEGERGGEEGLKRLCIVDS